MKPFLFGTLLLVFERIACCRRAYPLFSGTLVGVLLIGKVNDKKMLLLKVVFDASCAVISDDIKCIREDEGDKGVG